MRVLLVSMPFAALERPALGLSLLQARLRQDGVPCDLRYLGPRFAEYIGYDEYRFIQSDLPYTAFAGDWMFTRALYGERSQNDAEYIQSILRELWQLDAQAIARILRARSYCEHFLEHGISTLPWDAYDMVGFTSTFEQNLASLALARRIKERYPQKLVVFGGANWEGEMGVALHERFPFIDFVCSGEADVSFPALLSALNAGTNLRSIPGIVYREGDRTISTGPAQLVADLDGLPWPDYDDFLDALASSPVAVDVTPQLLLETSRGCWWGEKNHCTFCGLNGGTMAFRSKTAERVIAEIAQLKDRYHTSTISVVDNILDMRYFATLLPMLERQAMGVNLFYEVKANLTRERVRQLAAAGITHIQPGIESLSDHVLALMRKGTTALQNIQLLKWCREYGVRPEWNFLYGFPGEEAIDYERMLPLIDAIAFLDPPTAYGPIRLDRFSPYHADPQQFGLTNVRPQAPYRFLYPDAASLTRIAYYFDFDYADGRMPLQYAQSALARVQRWMDAGPQGGVWLVGAGERSITLLRHDAGGRQNTFELEGWQADLYKECDSVHSLSRLTQLAASRASADDVRLFLSECVVQGLMVNTDDRYLGLAVRRTASAPAHVIALNTASTVSVHA